MNQLGAAAFRDDVDFSTLVQQLRVRGGSGASLRDVDRIHDQVAPDAKGAQLGQLAHMGAGERVLRHVRHFI
ncbi:hypothetical protein D3C73_1368600 [compost metagenome]